MTDVRKIDLNDVDWGSSKDFFASIKNELEKLDKHDESYDFTWVGKRKSVIEAGAPINKTLRPDVEASKDFDNTKNMLIVGDNLDALKLLQQSYLGKVKMIYIDPPYNTGHDFVYHDNFTVKKTEYGDSSTDEEGNILVSEDNFSENTKSNGRFHSDWLSMMYPRLRLARNLLTDDGIILVSIDENEYAQLKILCDEVFGQEQYVENFIWIKNSTKNLSRTTSTNHEYILCYAKNIDRVSQSSIFRQEKPGLSEVKQLLAQAVNDGLSAQQTQDKLRNFYKINPELKGISMYNRVEERFDDALGQKYLKAYRLDNISAPKSTGRAATYDVIHPVTGRPCKCPTSGWRFTRSTMDEHIKNGLIWFGDTELQVPQYKRFLDTVETEVVKSTFEDFTDGKKELMSLFDGEAYFDNAKPTTILERFVKLTGRDAIIMDFFAGSGTTGHAVMEQNAKNKTKRVYISVQIDEKTHESSEAYKAGFETISDITAERLRRAGDKIKSENPDKDIDTGFRVFRIDSSNENEGINKSPAETNQTELFSQINNTKEDRTPLDLLFGVITVSGLSLDQSFGKQKINNNEVYLYGYEFEKTGLVACFDDEVGEETIKEIAKMQPNIAVFKDSSFKDSAAKINLSEHFKLLSPDTKVKIL